MGHTMGPNGDGIRARAAKGMSCGRPLGVRQLCLGPLQGPQRQRHASTAAVELSSITAEPTRGPSFNKAGRGET